MKIPSIAVVIILMLLTALAHGQTHNMPGSNVVPSGASLTINSGASITAAAGSTVTGFGSGGGGAPTTATYVTQTPDGTLSAELALSTLSTGLLKSTTTTGALTTITDSSTNWNTAFTQTRQWDGGATGLVAATGRTSLGLVIGTNVQAWDTDLDVWATKTPYAGSVVVTTGKTFTDTNNLTLSGTDGSTLNVGGGGTLGSAAYTASTAYAPATSGSSILYGNGSGGFSNVTVGSGLSFTTGTLTSTAGGNVSNSGTPVAGQIPIWTSATAIKGDTGLTYSGTGTGALVDIGGTDLGFARNAAGTLEINNGTAGQWGGLRIGVRDAGTSSYPDNLIIGHQTTATAGGAGFGASILFNADDAAPTADQNQGRVSAHWSNSTHSTLASYLQFDTRTGGAALSGKMSLSGAGGLSVGQVGSGIASGIVACASGGGFTIGGAPTTGQILQSDGTKFTGSTPTWPTAAGTAGYQVRSDGTNFASYPVQLTGASTATVSAGYAADTYVAGSSPPAVTAGDFKASGQYHCVFDMTKTGAGVATPIITVRVGTAGAIGDTAVCTLTFSAGTGVIDSGMFEVYVNFRTVGSGTSAVFQAIGTIQHQGGVTGLVSKTSDYAASTSAGFNSSTATRIGLSFNGGTSFAGTNLLVQAQLEQP